LWLREEAEKRDHRKLGPQLELFHLDQTAPGMPYWLPKGLKVYNTLLEYWRSLMVGEEYLEIATPLINEKKLYETSGHWDHYRENMFIIPESETQTFCVKPMNCPNAMVVFNLQTRSYRDLPLRLADCSVLHRNEKGGSLHGLMRVQKFVQDDAHIFVRNDQIGEEFGRILKIAERFYALFGLKYHFRFGTRPEGFLGEPAVWDEAEAALKNILDTQVGSENYTIEAGEGAFYGPKLDILMVDSLGREWQTGTIQLDFQLPKRFDCAYIAEDGSRVTPTVVHRAIFGSFERFLGVLIEHTAGAFPAWLAPVQCELIPIADEQLKYAKEVAAKLRAVGLRVEIDTSKQRMQGKIRSAQLMKIPYMLVIGKKEVTAQAVSVRLRTEEDLGAISVDEFIKRVTQIVAEKSSEL